MAKIDKRMRQTWLELATRTGLTYERKFGQSSPRLKGMYRGYFLTSEVVEFGQEYPLFHNCIVLSINNRANIYLTLSEKDNLSIISKFLKGVQPVQVGDEEFYKRFVVTSDPPGFVTILLTKNDLRQRLLQAHYRLKIKVEDQKLYFEGRSDGASSIAIKDLQSVFDLLTDLAKVVDSVQWFL